MIITFANQKGGCGKTSTACLLALYWSEKGKQVAIRDLDPQGSSAAFVDHLENPFIREYDDAGEPDFILIDTPGGIKDRDLRNLLQYSDMVLIPFLLSPTDMRATGETVRRLSAHEKTRLLFNKVNISTAIFKDRHNYASLLGVQALKNHLGDRVAYKHALVDGWSALNTKARDELTQLAKEVERGI